MDLYLNELSIIKANNSMESKSWMSGLVDTYKTVAEKGFNFIRVSSEIYNRELAQDYTLYKWLHDKSVDREKQLLFYSKISKKPYIDKDINDTFKSGLYEFNYLKIISNGLGLAFLTNSLSISLLSEEQWDKNIIPISEIFLGEDNANIIEDTVNVNHVSKPQHINTHFSWIDEKKNNFVTDGKVLWSQKEKLFPHLSFCEDTKEQIVILTKNQPHFIQIKKKLFDLEQSCINWKDGDYNINLIPHITPESDNRLNRLASQLTFSCHDGQNRLFSLHLRYSPEPGRLYFSPDKSSNILYIGYVGMKID